MKKEIPILGRIAVCAVIGFLSASPGRSGNWPAFRGGSSAGVSEDAKPPVFFGPASNLLWQIEVPKGLSSPVIWGDSIYFTGSDSNRLVTWKVDRRAGTKLWERAVLAEKLEKVHGANSVATPTPVTDGHAVYCYFGSFGVVAYDKEGKELWRKPLPMPVTFMNNGTGTSPILAEDKLIVFLQIGADSHLLALNPLDGRELWRAPMPEYSMTYATPVHWKEGDRGFAGMMCVSRFTAFRVTDGSQAWWVDGLSVETCSTPVVAGDRLIISAAGIQGERSNMTLPPAFDDALKKFDSNKDGMISYEEIPQNLLFTDRQAADGHGDASLRLALTLFADMNKDEKLTQKRWDELRKALGEFMDDQANQPVVTAVRTGGSGDVTQSHIAWKETKGVPEVPSPLVYQGRVYLVRSGGILACRDVETGRLIYEKSTGSRGGYFASPVAADGQVYVASDRGTITVIQGGDTGEILARNDLNERIVASPALAEGSLYVRSSKRLWAFGRR